MPKSIVAEGKTTNEAIENGLKELKVSKNQVDIKVLESEDKRSFFSILAPRVVKVELTVKEGNSQENNQNNNDEINKSQPKEIRTFSEDELNKAEENANKFLNEFLSKLGDDAKFEINKDETGLKISITGESTGNLIGYRGETLYAFQTILSSVASKGMPSRIRIILDIEGYKAKRQKTLEDLAEKIERTVYKTKRAVTLEPMKAYERKIIHTKLQNSNKVVTHSIGEEPRRRVVISVK